SSLTTTINRWITGKNSLPSPTSSARLDCKNSSLNRNLTCKKNRKQTAPRNLRRSEKPHNSSCKNPALSAGILLTRYQSILVVVFQFIDAWHVQCILQGLVFNLADTFTCYAKLLPYFFQGMRDAVG